MPATTNTAMSMSRPDAPQASTLLLLFAIGNFVVGFGAFSAVGLLSPLSRDLALTPAAAGWVMTSYALAYAVGSPVFTALSGRFERRTVLAVSLLVLAAGLTLSALAPSAAWLYVGRVLTALGGGLFTPGSAALAVAMVTPAERGKALATVFAGVTAAQVIGVPAASFLAYTFGWHAVFTLCAVLALLAAALVWWRVPTGIPVQVVSLASLGGVLRDARLVLAVFFTATFLGAAWTLFTFLGPMIEQKLGFARNGVTLLLVIYGIGAFAGNMLGGRLTDKLGSSGVLVTLAAVQVGFLALLPVISWTPVLAAILLFVWAAFGWSFMVPQQARLVSLGPDRVPILLALNAACIYIGAALGSGLGGYAKTLAGAANANVALAIAGGLFGLVALFHILVSLRLSAPAR
jgi:DHA1 family inner membrane transport protein